MRVQHAIEIFTAGVNAVKPGAVMPQHLALHGDMLNAGGKTYGLQANENVYVLAIGKAAAAMAQEAEKVLGHRCIGLVVTKYAHSLPLQYCQTIEAGHPIPDENSVGAAKAVIDFLQTIEEGGVLICCISGGASALLGDLAKGISLHDMQQLSTQLLACGADIYEINTLRKHLSTLKGGQLAQYVKGVDTAVFIISDVLGDDLSVIASGPTVADSSTYIDAFKVLKKYDLFDECPLAVTRHIIEGVRGSRSETPKPGDALFNRVSNYIIGSNHIALQAAKQHADQLGYNAFIINEALQGEAETQAANFIADISAYNGTRPACFLMGGETTVTIKGNGKGGRNQHFVLACLHEYLKQNVPSEKMPVILSAGTDGTDGPTDAAGAYIDGEAIKKMRAQGLNPLPYLKNNDAYNCFKQLDTLLITGPTQTNVMDIVVALID